MQRASLQDGTWESITARISDVVDVERTAREFKAFLRARKIRTPQALLRLAMIYGPGQQSLRSAAALAGDAGIAELSDKAVEGRLRKMGAWLEHILLRLLANRSGVTAPAASGVLDLALVDGSVICSPGKDGGDWRLHACYHPATGRFGDLVLTSSKVAERVDHTAIRPGQVVIQDRGYARVRNFHAVLAAQANFLTRIGWRSLRLRDADGSVLDLLAELPADDTPREREVRIEGIAQPLRLLIQRLPAEQAARQQRKRVRKAAKQGHAIDARTTRAAGYLMLLTSLPAASHPTAQAIALYGHRWQVEIGFKRLKTLGGLDRLPACDPALARTWLLAHLIAAVLADDLAHEIVGFPPSARTPRAATVRPDAAPQDHPPGTLAVARLEDGA